VPGRVNGRGLAALAVALVTISDGADSVAAYIPLFSSSGRVQGWMLSALFMALTSVWVAAAYTLNPVVGRPIRRLSRFLLPGALIGVGVLILVRFAFTLR
jgi:cadmium resistance protein CadD (predicted permease)